MRYTADSGETGLARVSKTQRHAADSVKIDVATTGSLKETAANRATGKEGDYLSCDSS